MRKIKAAELVLDFEMYPRNNIDSVNVSQLRNAMEAGAELPPIVICAKTKRVVDGFHRTRAAILTHGPDAELLAVEKKYANDAEFFLDSVRYNASHGARLDSCDRTRCVLIGERLSIPPEMMGGVLHMPVAKLAKLTVDRTATAGGIRIPIKRTIRHKAGDELTDAQVEANKGLSGMSQVFYVNQVISLIESDLLDTGNEALVERLVILHELSGQVLATAVAMAA